MHCNIITQNNPFLMEICNENWVEINRADAARYGIEDGGYVIVESPKDKIRIKVQVVEGLVPGCVSIRHGHGFGHSLREMSRLRDCVQDLERGRGRPPMARGREDRERDVSQRPGDERIDGMHALRRRAVPNRVPGHSDHEAGR